MQSFRITDEMRQKFSIPPSWRRILRGILASVGVIYTTGGFFYSMFKLFDVLLELNQNHYSFYVSIDKIFNGIGPGLALMSIGLAFALFDQSSTELKQSLEHNNKILAKMIERENDKALAKNIENNEELKKIIQSLIPKE